MATLNLSKMKYMSETNLKKFANLIISLSSQVTDVENKCIKPYVDGELYPRDSYVSYNGYIYQATATNQDSAFDETHWDKLSDDFNELTVADIEAMLGLSQEQLETMANLIADTEVRLDKTYSSSKIYQDIQQCLNDSKSYTLKEIAKLNGSSYKVVTSTSEMTSESIIYLLASGNTYDMYIVEENGATTKIGNMDVNLDNYFTKAEIEADYLKKTDADGKYATITTVDGKVDKDKIATVLDDTVTDEQVASAKVVYEELDKKIEGDNVVKKDDIATVLDDSVTDEQVPSAKVVYTEISKGFNGVLQEGPLQVPNNNMNELTEPYYFETVIDTSSIANFPPVEKGITRFKLKVEILSSEVGMYRQEIEFQAGVVNQGTWYRNLVDGNWNEWKKMCYTTVENKSKTLITFPDETNHKIATATETYYIVKNGICFVHLVFITVTADTITQVQNLPIPLANATIYGQVTQYDYKNITSVGARVALFNTGILDITGGNVGTVYTCSFSYPVAE